MIGKKFVRLFNPYAIGPMQLKNRIVMPPMGTHYANPGGFVSQRLINYHEARAKGGAGLLIIESTVINYKSQISPPQLSLGADGYIAGFRKLADAVHKYGAKVAVQLNHAGPEIRDGKPVQVAPTAIIIPTTLFAFAGKMPTELTASEIEGIVRWFALAAGRAQKAGLDGVEIHAAHSYLVASFLSPVANKRKDKYGGTVENRARFLTDIIRAMREEVGPEYPVWPRINAQEWGRENGTTIGDTKKIVQLAVKAGASAISVSGVGVGRYLTTAPISDTPGILLPLSEAVKKVVSVPVIVAGRMDAETGEKALQEGKADLIAIGRRILADPEWPNKVIAGKVEDINPCIGCMECIERLGATGATCVINPAMGLEKEYRLRHASKRKRVVIIGGGPAGMETARVASLRGHKVILIEKSSELGGILNSAGIPPHKGDIYPFIKYLAAQIEKAGVKVELNIEATTNLIMKNKPDAVVVATGGNPLVPNIPGINESNVAIAEDVLCGKVSTGQKVVVIGGGMVGCETGHFLAENGKNVTIIEMLKEVAGDMLPRAKRRLFNGLEERNVTVLTGATCEQITGKNIKVNTANGQKTIIADTIILAAGYKVNESLFKEIADRVPEIYCVGDSSQVRRISDAMADGYRVGLLL